MVTQTKTAAAEQAASAPIDPGVRIGHVHLKVADLDRALAFYCGVLGFQLMQRMGAQAAFISAAAFGHDRPLPSRRPLSDAGGARRRFAPPH